MDEQKPKSMIEIIKEAGYVMVVRCKDCKHYRIETVYPGTCMVVTYCAKMGFSAINPDWFCADGERKSDDEKLMEEMDADPLG